MTEREGAEPTEAESATGEEAPAPSAPEELEGAPRAESTEGVEAVESEAAAEPAEGADAAESQAAFEPVDEAEATTSEASAETVDSAEPAAAEAATGEPGEGASAAPAPTEAAAELLAAVTERVEEGTAKLLAAFEEKLAYDRGKDAQISRLHSELQEHKRDLLAKATRPLLMGVIRLHDDLGKMVRDLEEVPPESLGPERFFDAFEGFAQDLEMLLERFGVETFEVEGERFDPARQSAFREETDDPEKVGTIAARLRPGFQTGETVLQKERVLVYAASRRAGGEPAQTESDEPVATEDAQE